MGQGCQTFLQDGQPIIGGNDNAKKQAMYSGQLMFKIACWIGLSGFDEVDEVPDLVEKLSVFAEGCDRSLRIPRQLTMFHLIIGL